MEKYSTQAYIIDSIFLSAILGFCFGIIYSVFFRFGYDLITISIFGIVILFLGVIRQKKIFLYLSIFLFSMLVGVARMDFATNDVLLLDSSVGQKITLEGVIDIPVQKSYNQQAVLSLSSGQNVLIYTANYPRLKYGDKISINGTLQNPKNFQTDQGSEFDYIGYLYKDNIKYILKNGKASIISRDNGNFIVDSLLLFKDWFINGYQKILPPSEADLMGGLTLGTKENIDKEFRNSLVETSTIHIIALSGYNVTIVANFLRGVFSQVSFIGSRGALFGGALGIIFFVAMTGMQSSAIRAGLMALIALLGRGTGRTYDAFRALLIAGCTMIIWNPKFLVYDVSFQLSFLATLGMIFLTPIYLDLFKRVPENIFNFIPLRELMSTTLGAQTAVVPFIIYKMGVFSLIALPANILVLPAVPLAMGVGTVAGILGNFSINLATPFAFVTHLLLQYIIILVNFFASVPFAYISFRGVPIFLCFMMYSCLIFWVYQKREILKK